MDGTPPSAAWQLIHTVSTVFLPAAISAEKDGEDSRRNNIEN
jgi:hypothetical protein